MNTRDLELILLGLTLTTPISIMVKAEVYFDEVSVTKALFPGEKFESSWIVLTDEQVKIIEKESSERVRDRKIRVWKSTKGNMVFIDRVVGKHDFITYAVGISKVGRVQGTEIMEYRESYGHQVRKAEWRNQFIGKDNKAQLKINADIKNISGATLSSVHVTGGVRRILRTYEAIKTTTS